ncbi:MAG TPA: TonB-dependent receptor, partial [Chitinophagaceae bacterium]|nr:TonB-dependent receptor [Chitinophagaceae bacterium]
MKGFAATGILLGLSLNSPAQMSENSGSISGRVLDSSTHQPVPYVTVALFRGNQAAPENGGFTNQGGIFSLGSLPAGTYRVRIDAVGYHTSFVNNLLISPSRPKVVLGNVFLTQASTTLKTVLVQAQAPLVENRPDMLVFHADKDITSIGGVATDVLKKVPEVSVDVDGNVELQGDPNVRVLINGKPSSIFGSNLTEALQSIPASQIKDIQVITTPGAKYDAEGTAGILNIVLKENTAYGVHGEVIASAGSRLENGSFNFQARQGHFGIHASLSGHGNLNSTTLNGMTRNSVDSAFDQVLLLQNGQGGFTRRGYMSNLGFDWDLTPRDNLSGSIGYDNFMHYSNGYTDQTETFASKDSTYTNS